MQGIDCIVKPCGKLYSPRDGHDKVTEKIRIELNSSRNRCHLFSRGIPTRLYAQTSVTVKASLYGDQRCVITNYCRSGKSIITNQIPIIIVFFLIDISITIHIYIYIYTSPIYDYTIVQLSRKLWYNNILRQYNILSPHPNKKYNFTYI